MALEDECKQLMYYRDKIKEYKQKEEEVKTRIIKYLKNHNQEGVVFKHNDKRITLMVNSVNVKKNISKKEKEKKVHNILENAGVKNVDLTTLEIINGMQQVSLMDRPTKDKLKFKTAKK